MTENPIVLSTLRNRRAQLAQEVADLRHSLSYYTSALEHLDGVLAMLDPERDPNAIPGRQRRKAFSLYERGAKARALLVILRKATGPLCLDDIVREMAALALDAPPRAVRKAVRNGLESLKRDGRVIKTGFNDTALWAMKPTEPRTRLIA